MHEQEHESMRQQSQQQQQQQRQQQAAVVVEQQQPQQQVQLRVRNKGQEQDDPLHEFVSSFIGHRCRGTCYGYLPGNLHELLATGFLDGYEDVGFEAREQQEEQLAPVQEQRLPFPGYRIGGTRVVAPEDTTLEEAQCVGQQQQLKLRAIEQQQQHTASPEVFDISGDDEPQWSESELVAAESALLFDKEQHERGGDRVLLPPKVVVVARKSSTPPRKSRGQQQQPESPPKTQAETRGARRAEEQQGSSTGSGGGPGLQHRGRNEPRQGNACGSGSGGGPGSPPTPQGKQQQSWRDQRYQNAAPQQQQQQPRSWEKEEHQPQQLRVLQRGDPENLRFWVAPPRVKRWCARMAKKEKQQQRQ